MISIEATQNAQLCSSSDESSTLPLLEDLQTRNKHLESMNEAYISKISEMKQLLQEFTTSIDRSKSCIHALKEDNFNLESVVRDLREEIHSNKQTYTKEEVKLRDGLESALINEAMLKDKLQNAEEKILLLQGAQTGNNFISLESGPNAIKGSSEISDEAKSNEGHSLVEGHEVELKRLLKELTDAKSKIFYLEEEKVDRDMELSKLSNNEANLLNEIEALKISMQESKNDYKILKESFTSKHSQLKAVYDAQERIRDLERENAILKQSKNVIQKKLDDSTKAIEQMKKKNVHENVDLSFDGRSLPVDATIEQSKAIHSNNVIKRISSIIELSELARDQVSIVTNDSESEKKEEYEALFQGIVNTEDKELDRLWAELRDARNTIADLEAEKITAKSTIYRLEEDIVHLREKCKEPTQTFSSQSNLNKKSIGAFARRLSSGW